MTERVELEAGFILHARRWRETSELIEAFTPQHGCVSLVARGMRRGRAPLRAILQPFQPLVLSWSGRGGGLMTLRAAEAAAAGFALADAALMSGFYLNELLLRFLHRGDPHPRLFEVYADALGGLAGGALPDAVLRGFEIELLAETGYGLNLDHDAASGEPLAPARSYRYELERGPLPLERPDGQALVFSGGELLAMGCGDFSADATRRAAKRLLRAALDHHLGGRPLYTRAVFSAMRR